jgi:dTDP-4-amino-4,6-dideoxygalactose transaminase
MANWDVPLADVVVTDDDLAAVTQVYRSGWLSLGPETEAFERAFAGFTGAGHAVGLSNGTAALHLACLAAGLGPGDEVVVPSMTFVATVNAVVYTGAEPVFVDCDVESGNMAPELLDAALTQLRAEGARVAAVVPVDFLGRCADYTRLIPVCERHGVSVVSDAAESLGSSHSGRPAGALGATAAFSVKGNKIN